MSDTNNNLGDQNQDQANDNSLNQNNQLNQAEGGSTYWESNEVQEAYDVQADKPEVTYSEPIQDVRDISYDEFKDNQYDIQKKKKSRKKPIFAVILTLVILMATAATAYAFSDTLRNSIDMLIKNPKDYYANIEYKSIESSVDKSIALMNMRKNDKNFAQDVTAKLSYDKDTVGAMLQGLAGMSISDLEAFIGIPLDSIGFNLISANDDDENYQKIGINLNNIELISGEIFINNSKQELLYYLPELSSAYLRQSLDMEDYGMDEIDLDGLTELLEKLSSESTGDFIKRYAKIITSEIDDVKLTKKVPLTVGDVTVESNLLTVTIYPETLKNIIIKSLKEAKNDEYILDILSSFNISKGEYLDVIDESIEEITDSLGEHSEDDEVVVMKLYVGKDGNILGRKTQIISPSGESVDINFLNVSQNDKGAYDLLISEDEDDTIRIKGNHSIKNEAYTGSGQLIVNSYETGSMEFDFEYEGLKTEIKNKSVFLYGNISLSSYEMMGMEIVLEFDAKDGEQLFAIKLNMGKSSLVTLETSTKSLDNFTIPKPDGNADIYDMLTEIEDYTLTMDVLGYISTLSDRLGVNLEGLLGGLLPAL